MPDNINKTGGGGARRLIFTGNVKTTLFNKYTPGSGVGALNRSVRRALVRRAPEPNCKGICSNVNGNLVWDSMGRYAYYKQFRPMPPAGAAAAGDTFTPIERGGNLIAYNDIFVDLLPASSPAVGELTSSTVIYIDDIPAFQTRVVIPRTNPPTVSGSITITGVTTSYTGILQIADADSIFDFISDWSLYTWNTSPLPEDGFDAGQTYSITTTF